MMLPNFMQLDIYPRVPIFWVFGFRNLTKENGKIVKSHLIKIITAKVNLDMAETKPDGKRL